MDKPEAQISGNPASSTIFAERPLCASIANVNSGARRSSGETSGFIRHAVYLPAHARFVRLRLIRKSRDRPVDTLSSYRFFSFRARFLIGLPRERQT
jgi:hypothetical protein